MTYTENGTAHKDQNTTPSPSPAEPTVVQFPKRPSTLPNGPQTQAGYENFHGVTGYSASEAYPDLIKTIAVIKSAAAYANYASGSFAPVTLPNNSVVNADTIQSAIRSAAYEVINGKWKENFKLDVLQGGAGTSLHMNVNEAIATRANQIILSQRGLPFDAAEPLKFPIHPNDHVNLSQSTNDVIPTAVKLAVYLLAQQLSLAIENLRKRFTEKADSTSFKSTLQVGRTHLQDAVPIRASQTMMSYVHTLDRLLSKIAAASMDLTELALGATAVGTGIDTRTKYHELIVWAMNCELDEHISRCRVKPAKTLLTVTNSMGPLVSFANVLNESAIELTRIANDIRLLASGPAAGIGEYKVQELQPGSSIMPGKSNPVMAELLNQACFWVMGNVQTVHLAAQNGQLQLNVMLPVAAFKLLEAIQVLSAATNRFADKCIALLELNHERVKQNLNRSYCTILALKPLLGYELCARIAKEQIRRGVTLEEVITDQALLGTLGISHCSTELLAALGNVESLTAPAQLSA